MPAAEPCIKNTIFHNSAERPIELCWAFFRLVVTPNSAVYAIPTVGPEGCAS